MKSWIRDVVLAVIVVLALPIGMVGPALTLPALVYGFPLILVAVLLGLVALIAHQCGWIRPGAARRGSAVSAASAGTRLSGPALDVASPTAGPRAAMASEQELQAQRRRARRLLDAGVLGSAKPLAGGPFHRILVLLDAGDFSPEALARAAATARRDGAELVLAGLLDYEEARRRAVARGIAAHHPAVVRQLMGKDLENLRWGLERLGLRARSRLVVGEPEIEGPGLAREERADLVVLVPPRPRLLRGRPEPPEWAHRSPCPVLPLAA